MVCLPRLPGRHHRRRIAGHRAAFRHQHSLASNFRPRHHQVGGDAGRHLLRLAIRRLDHFDPDADPGRSLLGHDLHRRLCDGAERTRWRSLVHRRRRLVGRRHVRGADADVDRAAARHIRAALRAAGIYRAACARPDLSRLHVLDIAAAHTADGVLRAPARHHRHRQYDRALPLLLRHRRAGGWNRHRPGRDRPVRAGRDFVDAVRKRGPQGDRAAAARAAAQPPRMAGIGHADRARDRSRLSDRTHPRLRAHYFELSVLRRRAAALQAPGGIRQGRGRRRCRTGSGQ